MIEIDKICCFDDDNDKTKKDNNLGEKCLSCGNIIERILDEDYCPKCGKKYTFVNMNVLESCIRDIHKRICNSFIEDNASEKFICLCCGKEVTSCGDVCIFCGKKFRVVSDKVIEDIVRGVYSKIYLESIEESLGPKKYSFWCNVDFFFYFGKVDKIVPCNLSDIDDPLGSFIKDHNSGPKYHIDVIWDNYGGDKPTHAILRGKLFLTLNAECLKDATSIEAHISINNTL